MLIHVRCDICSEVMKANGHQKSRVQRGEHMSLNHPEIHTETTAFNRAIEAKVTALYKTRRFHFKILDDEEVSKLPKKKDVKRDVQGVILGLMEAGWEIRLSSGWGTSSYRLCKGHESKNISSSTVSSLQRKRKIKKADRKVVYPLMAIYVLA